MSGALNVMLARNTSSGSHLDTQTVETGNVGTAAMLGRVRGRSTGLIRVITGGTSNGGWTTLTIGSTVLTRASATYSSGTWTWSTTDTVGTQAFGASGSIHSCYFD